MTTFVQAERDALCDTALEVGPDAPTLSGDWTAKDLLCHLLVRERSAIGAPGISVPFLSRITDLEMKRLAKRDYAELVEKFRARPLLNPVALPQVDAWFNTLELFVHHEDLRRAQPEWSPRALDGRARSTIWKAISVAGKMLVASAGVPVTIRRTDVERTSVLAPAILPGSEPVVVSGLPGEVTLFLYGRAQTRDLTFDGPDESVRKLRGASLGL
jgi:uncharacterized protein (TIGR03085 family)